MANSQKCNGIYEHSLQISSFSLLIKRKYQINHNFYDLLRIIRIILNLKFL